MNKKQFLNTYKKINEINKSNSSDRDRDRDRDRDKPTLYRSAHDERLIKDFHYAKFQKNLQAAQQSEELQNLLNKEEWNEEDTQKLLNSLR